MFFLNNRKTSKFFYPVILNIFPFGKASVKQIFVYEKINEFLEPEDEIMVDKGFSIVVEYLEKG
jgi:hypothetical protein